MIDEHTFFRAAALGLCGSLELADGMRACLESIRQHMPADALYLERYERDLGAMRIIARADTERGERMDRLIPLARPAQAAMDQVAELWAAGLLPPVIVVNRPHREPVTSCLLDALGEPTSSVLSLPIAADGRLAGTLALLARGEERFGDDHIRLFGLLGDIVGVAVANAEAHDRLRTRARRCADEARHLNRELIRQAGDEVVGTDGGLRDVMRQVDEVAPTDSPVLLIGEAGVGKDVIAGAIHRASERRDGPLIRIACRASTRRRVDGELFGHEPGAFAGALTQRRGGLERAHDGTIVLDGISELLPDSQLRLVGAIRNREAERIGGAERFPVNVRIVATTRRDLQVLVDAGRFREDLRYRLGVYPIVIPPLRERRDDIAVLVKHLVRRKTDELQLGEPPPLAADALDRLRAHDWPGNVRELANVVERALILQYPGPLRFDDVAWAARAATSGGFATRRELPDLDTVVADHIRRALDLAGGKIHGPDGAGDLLGINPNTLRYRMRKLGIAFPRSRRS